MTLILSLNELLEYVLSQSEALLIDFDDEHTTRDDTKLTTLSLDSIVIDGGSGDGDRKNRADNGNRKITACAGFL